MGERLASPEYQAALDYILSFADYERASRSSVVFDTYRVEELLRRLGEPQKSAKSVHIAGTKGKGSTAAMVASVLTAAGYRTGLYTSPHLHTMRERIKVDGEPITAGELTAIVNQLKPEIESINQNGVLGELTTFEILTAIAFVHFRSRKVNLQVLEVGLGGRLDATNVVEPEVCVITSVSLDHTEVLGDTLPQIAKEKAGIIKPGTVVVTAPQCAEVFAVIEGVCREKGAKLILIGRDVMWRKGSHNVRGQCLQVDSMKRGHDLFIPLLGAYQLENAAIAVAALDALAERGTAIGAQNLADGLAQVKWDGRLQIVLDSPLFVVDGAHNAYSIKKLGEALKEYFDFERLFVIIGTSKDKDVSGIVMELASFSDTLIVTRSCHPRAAETSELVAEFSKWGVVPLVAEDVESSVRLALNMANSRDMICATGSLFIVAEVVECVEALHTGQ